MASFAVAAAAAVVVDDNDANDWAVVDMFVDTGEEDMARAVDVDGRVPVVVGLGVEVLNPA